MRFSMPVWCEFWYVSVCIALLLWLQRQGADMLWVEESYSSIALSLWVSSFVTRGESARNACLPSACRCEWFDFFYYFPNFFPTTFTSLQDKMHSRWRIWDQAERWFWVRARLTSCCFIRLNHRTSDAWHIEVELDFNPDAHDLACYVTWCQYWPNRTHHKCSCNDLHHKRSSRKVHEEALCQMRKEFSTWILMLPLSNWIDLSPVQFPWPIVCQYTSCRRLTCS